MVEGVIAAAIILGAVLALLGVHNLYLKTALSNGEALKAVYLAEEGIENIRFLRDVSWSTNISGLTSLSTTIDNFYRTVTLSEVNRDANSDIVSSGGTVDINTKLVVSSVSWWNGVSTTTKSISTYITNLYAN